MEAVSNMIVRRVLVNRKRTGQEAIDATDCVQFTDRKVVDSMPQGEGEEVEIYFFEVNHYVDNDPDKEYESRGLKPADPYSLAAVNEADSVFTN